MRFVKLVAVACVSLLSTLVATAPAKRAPNIQNTFKWSSSGPLIGPKNDGRNIKGIKDPSVVFYNGKYHVFASTAVASGYSLVYMSFTDFTQAGNAPFVYLDQSAIGTGYRAAPQVFYFAPQKLWYLVYQNGNAAYSTNPDINNPYGWTAPKTFYNGTPQTIVNALKNGGNWVDMWVICDTSTCHLFSSDDNGHLFRSQTSLSAFPSGMSEPVVALQDSQYALFEASNVYRIAGTSPAQYLLLVEAFASDGNRYFRSWTSNAIGGSWTQLAASEGNPFARSSNVAFSGTPWTKHISHGEVVRTVVDQTLTISGCKLRYLYQGLDPAANSGDYNSQPWRLGLLTQTNSAC